MDKKLRNIIIYITVAVMVVLGVAFLMTKNSSESYTTSQLVNLFKEDKVQSYTVNYGTGAIEITLKAVSYTHLTLPTNREVEVSVVACFF